MYMCIDVCTHLHIDVCIDVCMDKCTEPSIVVRVEECIIVRADMCIRHRFMLAHLRETNMRLPIKQCETVWRRALI